MRLSVSFCLLSICLIGICTGCGDSDFDLEPDFSGTLSHTSRARRSIVEDRKACKPGDEQPITRVDSSASLSLIRSQLQKRSLDAFLIPSGDSHQSEYVAPADQRGKWASGFSGKGFAVVTRDQAATWADGRYTLQGENQLDCNWLFFHGTEGGDSGWISWLQKVLPAGAKVGGDPTLTSAFTWEQWKQEMADANLDLVPLRRNLIDEIWPEDERPKRSDADLEIHDVKYAGSTWQDKIDGLRASLSRDGYDATVITALDETAWLFNLRGNDILYSPVFRSYAVVSMTDVILYLVPQKQTENVKRHLNSQDCSTSDCVQLRDYDSIFDDLPGLSESWTKVLVGKKWAYSQGPSYAIYSTMPKEKLKFDLSPVMLSKARKNKAEVKGMINANIRDAVALIDLAQRLDEGMANGEQWDELKVKHELQKRRAAQDYYKSDSFKTISAYGPNGAVIHYKPTNATNAAIGTDNMFLLDSGGQYLDGTTDVTRTFHFGKPTAFMVETYTRVLMGAIDLARAVFRKGTPDTRLDQLARWHLHSVGLNYRHGTGHGIGAYGLIHESPIQVRVYAKEEHPFEVGQFFSDEPGYYQADEFGIRLETVLRVVKREELKYSDRDDHGENFLGFEPVCLVPFEPKLIDYSLLNNEQVDWLNRYNSKIRNVVGPMLLKQGKKKAYDYMMERTEIIDKSSGGISDGIKNTNFRIANIIAIAIVVNFLSH